MPRMEEQRPESTSPNRSGLDPAMAPATGHDGAGRAHDEAATTPDGSRNTTESSEIGPDGDPEWVDTDWADPDPEDVLADITDAIERLTQLDPADAAAPGAAIADILSRALEEEER
jgi:hypothetical protein